MKNIVYICLIGLFLFSACDKIESPYIYVSDEVQIGPFPPLNPSSVHRKILIEEYTGHLCANCPVGHAKLAELSAIFGEKLAIVCIHAGELAKPRPKGLFTYDFRTEEGTQLYNGFGIDPIPVAVVNRTPFGGGWAIGPEQWQNAILNIANDVYAGIQIETKIKDSSLIVGAKATMLKNYGSPLQLSLFLIEDSVIRPQLNGTQNIEKYSHNHVFRAAVNGTYGAPIFSGDIVANSADSLGYKINFKNKDWRMEHIAVVAFLHNPATREVLQVEMAKIHQSK